MKQKKDIEKLCFDNFLETGEIGYYLLYSKLKEDKNERRDNNKSNCNKKRKISRK